MVEVWFTATVTSECRDVLNPSLLTVRSYSPGWMLVIAKQPALFVAALRSRFVPRLCRMTVASGITPPLESRTVPLIAPPAWARAVPGNSRARPAKNKMSELKEQNFEIRGFLLNVIIASPSRRCTRPSHRNCSRKFGEGQQTQG